LGRIDDVADQVLVALEAKGKLGFVPDAIDGLQEQLGDIGENGGFAGGDAILGEQVEYPAESLVHVGSGVEGAVGGKLVAAEVRIADFPLSLGVEIAEGRVGVDAGDAAAAIQGIIVLTAR
jgi:hypothetical protein